MAWFILEKRFLLWFDRAHQKIFTDDALTVSSILASHGGQNTSRKCLIVRNFGIPRSQFFFCMKQPTKSTLPDVPNQIQSHSWGNIFDVAKLPYPMWLGRMILFLIFSLRVKPAWEKENNNNDLDSEDINLGNLTLTVIYLTFQGSPALPMLAYINTSHSIYDELSVIMYLIYISS